MKKYNLKWGEGLISRIQKVYKTMEVEAENMDALNPLVILPEELREKIEYVRTIICSDTRRSYDYGSWSEFIEAEELK